VYLATTKNRFKGISELQLARVQHRSVVLTEIEKERKRATMEVYYHYTKSESRGDSS